MSSILLLNGRVVAVSELHCRRDRHSETRAAWHGLRRSNVDKRRAVNILLGDEEWKTWSNRKIAECCSINEKLVRTLRSPSAAKPQIPRKVERNGAVYEMQTGNIGETNGLGESPPLAPDKADERRLVSADNLSRDKVGTEDTGDKLMSLPDSATSSIKAQLEELLSAWARASEKVQQQFLAAIGVSPQVNPGSDLAETEPAHELDLPSEPTSLQEPSRVSEPSERPKPSHDPGPHATKLSASELVAMWNGYNGHTKTYGRLLVEAGCPDDALPGEAEAIPGRRK